jgi:hypothetical protein
LNFLELFLQHLSHEQLSRTGLQAGAAKRLTALKGGVSNRSQFTMKICISLLFMIFFCNVFAQDIDDDIVRNFPADFISKYAKALEYCSNTGITKYKLDDKSLRILSTLQSKQLRKYLVYKYELSMNRCIEDNGGHHIIFLVQYMRDKKTPKINKEMINVFLDLISSSRVVDSVNFDKNMSPKKKQELNSIDYLNNPFNMVRVLEQVKGIQGSSANGTERCKTQRLDESQALPELHCQSANFTTKHHGSDSHVSD